MKNLELQRRSLPNEPGVYLFNDKTGTIIYVGSATKKLCHGTSFLWINGAFQQGGRVMKMA